MVLRKWPALLGERQLIWNHLAMPSNDDVRPAIFGSWGEALSAIAGLVFVGAVVIAACVLVLMMVVDLVLLLK